MWLLPPVFGQVTADRAVVLCKPGPSIASCQCEIHDSEKLVSYSTCYFTTGTCQRFVFRLPGPGKYKFIWKLNQLSGIGPGYTCHIDTTGYKQLLFVSCDMLEAEASSSLWKKIQKEVDNPTVILHLGDQIYGDECYRSSVGYLSGISGEIYPLHRNMVIEKYCKRYTDTWSRYSSVTSLCSNLYLWDDHEIVNDYDHTTATETEKLVAECAAQVYHDFQHCALVDKDQDFSWTTMVDDICIIAVERTVQPVSVAMVLDRLEECGTDKVCLCFSSGPIPKPSGVFGSIYSRLSGEPAVTEGKFWDMDELTNLYEGCCSWMEAKEGRKLAIVGGDLHFGTYGVVSNGNVKFPVVVSSPISNQPTFDRWLASMGMKTAILGSTVFTPMASDSRRCYATISTEDYPNKVKMVFSKSRLPKSTINYLTALKSFV